MRDYKELVKILRACTSKDAGCMKCPRQNAKSFANDCAMSAVREAADAIEELVAKVPTWISAEERLPDDWKPVLAYDPIGYGEIGIAFIVGSLNTVVWRGVGFTNTAYPPNVTHWMPLPEPPKED